ncbi:hypothetical protein K7X08_016486 [Anisodus acutangulus]|uniref:Uncharacterized protein n=1 Tax=Anisodus acutangulus TaxID=402998 RepID=A0A9Q1LF96_9SOLA|nr:hypothetical protein K7X08_016486 [Anisodus acutangulus]
MRSLRRILFQNPGQTKWRKKELEEGKIIIDSNGKDENGITEVYALIKMEDHEIIEDIGANVEVVSADVAAPINAASWSEGKDEDAIASIPH